MLRTLCLVLLGLTLSAPAHSQSGTEYNEALGLPYWAPGRGDVDHDALRRRSLAVLESQYSAFVKATAALETTAQTYCGAGAGRAEIDAAFRAAWLAWAPLDSYQFGPAENSGAVLAINFWPDKKNFVGRALQGLLARPEAEQRDPRVVDAGSAGAQGLPAIEMLLFTQAQDCPALIGITGSLHGTAQGLYAGWFAAGGWADIARAAGPDNPVYLSAEEFTKTLYTALDFGLIRIEEQRLGRPLGTFQRSYPKRAEGWRSGMTAQIIAAQLDGMAKMIRMGFAGDIRDPDRAWALDLIDQAHRRIARIGMPIHEAVQHSEARLRVEALQTKIAQLRRSMAEDIGPNLGVDTGFSPADGD